MYSHYHQSDYEGENTVVYIWHKGGYEKLKPFGFWTYGAIDGYNRRILWLEVGRTNNNPKIIANYFTDYIRQIGEAPRIVCAENEQKMCMSRRTKVIQAGGSTF